MQKPTPEIIAQAKSLDHYVNHLVDPLDPEANDIFSSWYEITEQYDFYDQKFEENGLVGLKDIEGNLRVPALYSDYDEIFDIFAFRDLPVAAVNAEGKVALVAADGTGTPLCAFRYDHIVLDQDSGHYFYTMVNNKMGLLSRHGEELLPAIYDHIEFPNAGIYITQQEGKFGFFCEEGHGFTVPALYDEIDEDNAYLHARLGDQWGYFDTSGRFLPDVTVESPQQAGALRLTPLFLP